MNATRFDPYKQCKFRVKWDGRYVAGVSGVSPLRRTTQVVEHRDGGERSIERRSPGLTSYAAIRLERGRTHDLDFEQWANKVWDVDGSIDHEVSLKDFRKNITIELLNEAGQIVLAWHVYRCWPSEYEALSALDADGAEVAFETLTLEHEGWERDLQVVEPAEPGFSDPA